jgi:hypothetical protein
MNLDEAKQFIINHISVTPQAVIIAKAYGATHCTGTSRSLIDAFLKEMDALMPEEVVVHPSINSEPGLKKVAESISWQLAMCEAIWALVHDNIFLPYDTRLIQPSFSVQYSTIVGRGGGQRGDWGFDQFSIHVPEQFRGALSRRNTQENILSDGDLYIHELNVPNIHGEIEDALRDAVRCFRHELYTPALAMLAKASEGSWLELGSALLNVLPNAAKPTADKLAKELDNPWVSIAKKIQNVLKLYEHPGLQPVKEKSGVDDNDLKQVLAWSDVVRESRNVVHYGVQPPTANTYEKLAALLLGAVPHLRIIYRVYDAAQAVARENAATGI